MAFDELAGTANGVTVARGRTGLVTQNAPRYRRAISPLQAAAMARMDVAGSAWEGLSEESVAEWRRYARSIVRTGDVSGKKYNPLAFNVFSGLFCKLLQIDPSAAVPEWPPSAPMPLDRIGVAVSVTPEGVLYVASRANLPGMLTELFVQKLPGRHRVPRPKSNSAGFRAFTDADRTFALPVAPGTYFCACAVVEAGTGRSSRVMPIGTLHVPDSAGV